jgi:hypothetical protein
VHLPVPVLEKAALIEAVEAPAGIVPPVRKITLPLTLELDSKEKQ